MTMQKKVLQREIGMMGSFFDAYELHARIAKKEKGIGLATVYRFLNTLENEGSIHAFVCDDRKIYSSGKRNHAHFRCEKCGASKHMYIKDAGFLKQVAGKACHFQIEVTGFCSECLRENQK